MTKAWEYRVVHVCTEIKQIHSLGDTMEKVVAETVWACKLKNCKKIKFNALCSNGVPFYNI